MLSVRFEPTTYRLVMIFLANYWQIHEFLVNTKKEARLGHFRRIRETVRIWEIGLWRKADYKYCDWIFSIFRRYETFDEISNDLFLANE